MHDMYEDDLEGKDLPGSLKLNWLWNSAQSVLMKAGLLVATITAATYFAHREMKQRTFDFRKSWMAGFIVAAAGFWYVSFVEPPANMKAREQLARIIYFDPLKDSTAEMSGVSVMKNERTATLTELMTMRDSFRVKDTGQLMMQSLQMRQYQKYTHAINEKFAFPLTVLLFFALGLLAGVTMNRLHVVFALLIDYLFVFSIWYYLDSYFENQLKSARITPFVGAFGPLLIFIPIAIIWYFLLRKMKFLRHSEKKKT